MDHRELPTCAGDDSAVGADEGFPSTIIDTSAVGSKIDNLGAGDSYFLNGFLNEEEEKEMFETLSKTEGGEIAYQQWFHMPQKKNSKRNLAPLRRIKVAMATAPEVRSRWDLGAPA